MFGLFKKLNIALTLTIAAALVVWISPAALAQTTTLTTYVSGDHTLFDGSFYLRGKASDIGTPGASGYDVPTNLTYSFSGALENLGTVASGDVVVALLERETNPGTTLHMGYYAVLSDIATKGADHDRFWTAVREIPRPTAVVNQNGTVTVSWAAAIDDGDGSNIAGYKVYRGTDGLVSGYTEIASVGAASTSTVDAGASFGGTYMYAVKILFTGTLATPELESKYMSANSGAVTVGTPGVSIISVNPYYGVQGTSLEVTIIGRNTNFNVSSEVAFEGLNHISVESVTYDTPTRVRAWINISSEAEIGFRNVVVTSPLSPTTDEVAVGTNMFVVIPAVTLSMVLNPNAGVRGATFNVAETGIATNFDQASSILFFGNDIAVNTLTVNSSTSAVSNITIGQPAVLGTRYAIMISGSEVALGEFIVNQLNIDDKIVPNYPNPFDPQREVTNIVIDLEEPTEVGIYIYDITARQVWRYRRLLPTGTTQVQWNGYTYYNKIGDNGVYIMKVVDETNKKIIGRGKVLIIKR